MNSIFAIARNTFREAIRNRILYLILLFSLIMIGSSGALSQLTIADRGKIIKDLGFTAISLFGVAIAIFLGVTLVYNELEKKSIYTIVSKPIDRWQFLLGKFFGLLMTIYVNIFIMTLVFLFMLHYHYQMEDATGNPSWILVMVSSAGKSIVSFFWWGAYPATQNIMPVIFATSLELGIITSFAILFSSFSTPILSMFMTVVTFISGRLNEDIILFAEHLSRQAAKDGSALPFAYYFSTVAAHITPNLGVFHRTVEQALYMNEVEIWWDSVLYALVYPVGILFLATIIFNRRNFK